MASASLYPVSGVVKFDYLVKGSDGSFHCKVTIFLL